MPRGYIEKLPSGRYRGTYWVDGEKLRLRGTFESREIAQSQINEKLQHLGESPRGSLGLHNTFNEWADFWLSLPMKSRKTIVIEDGQYSTSEKRSSTTEQYSRVIEGTARVFLGDMPLGSITESTVNAYIRWLNKTRSDQAWTISRGFEYASRIFHLAIKQDVISFNPFRGLGVVAPDKPTGKKIIFASENDLNRLRQALPHYLVIPSMVAAFSGIRAGELWGLKVKDIRLAEKAILVRRTYSLYKENGIRDYAYGPLKSSTPRETFIAPLLIPALTQVTQGRDPEAPLFVTQSGYRKGLPVRHTSVMDPFKRAAIEIGLPNEFSFHDLRHFFAQMCAKQGISLINTARFMGHKSPDVTFRIYGGLFKNETAEASEQFRNVEGYSFDLEEKESL